jgi:hypothetical protein
MGELLWVTLHTVAKLLMQSLWLPLPTSWWLIFCEQMVRRTSKEQNTTPLHYELLLQLHSLRLPWENCHGRFSWGSSCPKSERSLHMLPVLTSALMWRYITADVPGMAFEARGIPRATLVLIELKCALVELTSAVTWIVLTSLMTWRLVQTFGQWREERKAEKQRRREEDEADRKRKGIFTGREIFMQARASSLQICLSCAERHPSHAPTCLHSSPCHCLKGSGAVPAKLPMHQKGGSDPEDSQHLYSGQMHRTTSAPGVWQVENCKPGVCINSG